jgi:hypothetical protein
MHVLPAFPDMKKIELSDKETVKSFTTPYPPYSDFNFTSMWSWDTDGEMALAQLNGNLVVRFTDYVTCEPFYSFIGSSDVDATARTLLETSARQGLAPVLKLVPESAAVMLNADIFRAEADPAHADYMLSVERLHTFAGSAFQQKRRRLRQFLNVNPSAQLEVLDVRQGDIVDKIKGLFTRWFANKNASGTLDDDHEYKAFCRCIDFPSHLMTYGVYVGDAFVAFIMLEDVGGGFAICHFEKADMTTYQHVMPFLRQQVGCVLSERQFIYVNMEQDLGIEGLRFSKLSYAPDHYLKKYSVRFL